MSRPLIFSPALLLVGLLTGAFSPQPQVQFARLTWFGILLVLAVVILVVWLIISWAARTPRDVPATHGLEAHGDHVDVVATHEAEHGEGAFQDELPVEAAPAAVVAEAVAAEAQSMQAGTEEPPFPGTARIYDAPVSEAAMEEIETPDLARVEPATATQPVFNVSPVGEAGQVSPPAPDDLAIVEGIGPKIAAVLNQAGVMTFAQLANMGVDQLELILHQASLRLADPSSWPDQARLAADGDWAGLKALQDRLTAGRRTDAS
jgi:predicted flap endonuclease-1-like 5' DNA nuclease